MGDNFWSVEWERGAREVFRRVKEEAAAISDDYLGTVHLLLAAVAYTPVEQHGVPALCYDSVRKAIRAVNGPRNPNVVTITPWSQTPRFKLAIERAMRRAFEKSRPVNCGDIWHGLLADPASVALQVLRHLDVRVEELSKTLAWDPD